MGSNSSKTTYSPSFQAKIGVQEDIINDKTLSELAVKSNQMVIADMIKVDSILRSGDINKIREIFEIQCYSPLQNINYQDISKYSNSLHLAFELQNQDSIDYLCALCFAHKIFEKAIWILDFRGKNIFDICLEKGDKMIQLLVSQECEQYPVKFAMYCQQAKINLSQKGDQRGSQQLEKYQLKINDIPTLCSHFVSQYSLQSNTLIRKQNITFRLLRITEILNIRTHELRVFPEQFRTQDIVQSCYLDDCHLISVFKACILQNHQHLFMKLLPQYARTQEVLGFNSTCAIQFYKYGLESQLLEVDNFFLFSIKLKRSYSSEINLRSVYFNYIEKAWVQIRGGYGQSCGYSVDETILEVLNVPVIARKLSMVKVGTTTAESLSEDITQLIQELIQFLHNKYLVVFTTKQTSSYSKGKHHSLTLKSIEQSKEQYQLIFEDTHAIQDVKMTLEQLQQEMEYISVGLVRSNYSLTAQEISCGRTLDLVIVSEYDQSANLALYCHDIETISCTIKQNQHPLIILYSKTRNNYFNLSDSPYEQGFTQLKQQEIIEIHIEFLSNFTHQRIVSICYYSQQPIKVEQKRISIEEEYTKEALKSSY